MIKTIIPLICIFYVSECLNQGHENQSIIYLNNKLQQATKTSGKYTIENNLEYIDICYSLEDEQIQNLQANTIQEMLKFQLLFSKKQSQTQWKCYRFFDKSMIFSSNPNKTSIYQNGSQIISQIRQIAIKSTFQSIKQKKLLNFKNLEWTALEQFKINFAWNSQSSNYLISSIIMKSNKVKSVGIISKMLHGKGFHQSVRLSLALTKASAYDISQEQCTIVFEEVLPESAYIDVDELSSIYPSSKLYKDQLISVESPQYASKQIKYRFQVPFSLWSEQGINLYQFQMKVHFRYPTPVKGGSYSNVALWPFTNVIIKCSEGNIDKQYPIFEDYLANKGFANIPRGDTNQVKIVTTITLVAEVMCAILLMQKIKK